MSLQALATTLLLPPVGLLLAALVLLIWRGRLARALAALLLVATLALATPFVAGTLRVSLERETPIAAGAAPGAIVVLSATLAWRRDGGIEPGALTLERMRTAVELHRRTGLPLLVTGGVFRGAQRSIAEVMAESLAGDFAVPVRWIEPKARDTAENARFAATMLREAGIGAAYVVTHAWHMPRTLEAFAREGFTALPAPVAPGPVPDGSLWDWVPRADHWYESWLYLREWAGILVYRLRDG